MYFGSVDICSLKTSGQESIDKFTFKASAYIVYMNNRWLNLYLYLYSQHILIVNPDHTFKKLIINLKLAVPSFVELLELLQQFGIEGVYLAGGAVRNAFIDPALVAKDLDIFVTKSAFDKVKDFLYKTGKLMTNQFGTYRWFAFKDHKFYYDIIVIPDFYNGLWKCRDIKDVLNQFDITVNAIAFDLLTGEFYDPQNGLLDIQERNLRAVRFDYPEIPVSETISLSRNSVLWFRYQHYAQTLNLNMEPITANWLLENAFRAEDLEEFTQHFFKPSIK